MRVKFYNNRYPQVAEVLVAETVRDDEIHIYLANNRTIAIDKCIPEYIINQLYTTGYCDLSEYFSSGDASFIYIPKDKIGRGMHERNQNELEKYFSNKGLT